MPEELECGGQLSEETLQSEGEPGQTGTNQLLCDHPSLGFVIEKSPVEGNGWHFTFDSNTTEAPFWTNFSPKPAMEGDSGKHGFQFNRLHDRKADTQMHFSTFL